MTPLRMYGDQSFASDAAAIADGVVESLLDVNRGQIMQASRDLLDRSTIGALAIAHRDQRPPTFEDIYSLLRGRDDARVAAATACGAIPDLDQTVEFFTRELPDNLRAAHPRPMTVCALLATRSTGSSACRRCGASSTIPPTCRCATSSTTATS